MCRWALLINDKASDDKSKNIACRWQDANIFISIAITTVLLLKRKYKMNTQKFRLKSAVLARERDFWIFSALTLGLEHIFSPNRNCEGGDYNLIMLTVFARLCSVFFVVLLRIIFPFIYSFFFCCGFALRLVWFYLQCCHRWPLFAIVDVENHLICVCTF